MKGHFEQVFVPDDPCSSQLDYDMCVLGWAWIEMSKQCQQIFDGLDDVIRAINENAKKREEGERKQ